MSSTLHTLFLIVSRVGLIFLVLKTNPLVSQDIGEKTAGILLFNQSILGQTLSGRSLGTE